MKKTLITLIAAVAIVAVVGVAMAAEEEESKPRVKRNANVERRVQQSAEARAELQKRRTQQGQGTGRSGFQGRGPIDREAMMKRQTKMIEERAAKERKTHQTFVGKLKAIKKLADKEGAKKTSASLQELIDETNKKFEDKIKAQKDRMQRYMQGDERGATMRRPREDTEVKAPGKPAPEKGKGTRGSRGNRKPKEKVEKDEE